MPLHQLRLGARTVAKLTRSSEYVAKSSLTWVIWLVSSAICKLLKRFFAFELFTRISLVMSPAIRILWMPVALVFMMLFSILFCISMLEFQSGCLYVHFTHQDSFVVYTAWPILLQQF